MPQRRRACDRNALAVDRGVDHHARAVQHWAVHDVRRLVRPFSKLLRLSKTYWITCPKAIATLPKVVIFRDWLLAEASRDLRQLKRLGWSLRPIEREGRLTWNRAGIVPGASSTITLQRGPF